MNFCNILPDEESIILHREALKITLKEIQEEVSKGRATNIPRLEALVHTLNSL